MKKILSFMTIIFLVISGIGAIATNSGQADSFRVTSSELTFSSLNIRETSIEYVEAVINDVSTFLLEPGRPVLPKVVETFELPFGVKNIKVEVKTGEIVQREIKGEIQPAPRMLPLVTAEKTIAIEQEKDLAIYGSNEPYPSDWYSYSIKCGLNKENNRVTFVTIHLYPARYIPNQAKLLYTESSNIQVTYEETDIESVGETSAEYDLLIIAPKKFENSLEKLITHKNSKDISTLFETTEAIYNAYNGYDKPEQIKYFIKHALDNYNIDYVLLVGGLKSQIHASPKDDVNQGSKAWYLPVRYTNMFDNPKFPLDEDIIYDPGVISDLYYSDIYGYNEVTQQIEFQSWDPNGDHIYAAWNKPDIPDDENIDMSPDVAVGRLACRSTQEVKTVVDKIIKYETSDNSEWFNKITVITGDGFLDQTDLNIEWNTEGLPNGHYTIYAQCENKEGEKGPVDIINIEIDRNKETVLTFNHDDYLIPEIQDGYPAPPIAKICTVSPDDILGYTDFTYTPHEGEAYCNNFNPWANMSYVDGVLTIRGKSYDPKPYGNITHLHIWIKNKDGETIFEEWKNNLDMYYEGEWTTGEKTLFGRGGALYYMPDNFEKEIIWASNGKYTGQESIMNAIERGAGFVFMSGHGSPNSWGDHYPGVPGNRGYGSIGSLVVTSLRPWPPFFSIPLFPVDSINNGDKLPVTVIGGCHNSQFNVSMVLGVLDIMHYFFPNMPEYAMWCHGVPVPECMSWRFIRSPNGGAIATIGNTGLGYGMPGKLLTTGGGDGWITIEFFRQYGEHGQEILGNTHAQSIVTYVNTHDMNDLESGHPKTVQQWVLLGDPSLKIGGY
jgi:hypothetical protein